MSSQLAVVPNGAAAEFLDREKIDLIKNSILKGSTDLELKLFVSWCQSKQLDPLSGEAYAVRQGGSLQPASTIAGMRKIAARSGAYGPQDGPYWCGKDGIWRDVWLEDEAPAAARVGVKRTDQDAYTYSVATFKECGANKVGRGGPWATQPAHMLSIRAEAAALRRVFPSDLGGVYTKDELEEAPEPRGEDHPAEAAKSRPAPRLSREEREANLEELSPTPRLPEVVNEDTGEIETPESIAADIKEARESLGWTAADVSRDAEREGISLRSLQGLTMMRDRLQSMVTAENRYAQETIIDADIVVPAGEDRRGH